MLHWLPWHSVEGIASLRASACLQGCGGAGMDQLSGPSDLAAGVLCGTLDVAGVSPC